MAVIEEGIAAYLVATGTVHAVVADRIYHMRIPQGATIPCITYQRISTPRILTHDSSGATGDLTNPRFQFDAWAVTIKSAKSITDILRAALHGRTAATGGVTVRAILADAEEPEWDPGIELYRSRSDYIIWLQEA